MAAVVIVSPLRASDSYVGRREHRGVGDRGGPHCSLRDRYLGVARSTVYSSPKGESGGMGCGGKKSRMLPLDGSKQHRRGS